LALVDGSFDAALLQGLPAELRRGLASQGGAGDRIPFPCGALRVQAESGTARVRALLLETGLGRVGGEGSVDLRDETLALRLLADLRLGGVGLRAPVNVAGTLAAPRVGVSPRPRRQPGSAPCCRCNGARTATSRPWRALWAAAARAGGVARLRFPTRGGARRPRRRRSVLPPPGRRAAARAVRRASPRDLPRQAEEVLRGLFGRGR
jgi:AsmA protein